MDLFPLPDPIPLPARLPVMVLQDCYLFPGCALPLYIFEERYRSMLRAALAGDRMFCIGARTGADDDAILPWSTAGLISACVRQADGTSHLILHGLRRVRLAGWTQEEPFRIAAVQPLEIQSGSADEAGELLAELLELLPAGDAFCPKTTEKMRSQLSQGQCPDYVCDILAYQFVRDVETLRALLAETDTTRRLRLLSDALRRL